VWQLYSCRPENSRLISSPGYGGGYYFCDDDVTYIATELAELFLQNPDEKYPYIPSGYFTSSSTDFNLSLHASLRFGMYIGFLQGHC